CQLSLFSASFSFSFYIFHLYLLSFPTRRSSDLDWVFLCSAILCTQFVEYFPGGRIAVRTIHLLKAAGLLHWNAKVDELVNPFGYVDVALIVPDVIHIRIIFLVIHQLWFFNHLKSHPEFIPQFKRQLAVAPVAVHFKASSDLELQHHETRLLIEFKFHISLAVEEILLLKIFKEFIPDFIFKPVNPGLESNKRYFKLPAMSHDTSFYPKISGGKGRGIS